MSKQNLVATQFFSAKQSPIHIDVSFYSNRSYIRMFWQIKKKKFWQTRSIKVPTAQENVLFCHLQWNPRGTNTDKHGQKGAGMRRVVLVLY